LIIHLSRRKGDIRKLGLKPAYGNTVFVAKVFNGLSSFQDRDVPGAVTMLPMRGSDYEERYTLSANLISLQQR